MTLLYIYLTNTFIIYCIYRAKTIKNVVTVNEELTAEEWKRRYEREKEKVMRLRGKLEKAEEELERWRKGETVSADEQVTLKEESAAPTPSESSMLNSSLLQYTLAMILCSCNFLYELLNFLATTLLQPPPAPAPANKTMITSSLSSDERIRLEQERERLYLQLDEKDEEITQQCQLVEKLKEQLMEQEDLISTSRRDYEKLQQEMARIQAENEAAKDEVKEVLQALEELALNYDQKASEADAKAREFEVINEELQQKQVCDSLKLTSAAVPKFTRYNVKSIVFFFTNF